MRIKIAMSMLLLSATCATPSLANYFYNPYTNLGLNVGSAPSPTQRDVRENRLPRVVHAAPPRADVVADGTMKNTGKPAVNDQPSSQVGEGQNRSPAPRRADCLP
jgi:hypothetical protein